MIRTTLKLLTIGVAVLGISAANAKTAEDLQKEAKNKELILGLFSANGPDAITSLMADDYRQHNPTVADGKQGAIKFFTEQFKLYPNAKATVARVAADGDLVWVHAHIVRFPNDPGLALVDIFRIRDGKLVEHWDVIQDVPAKGANENSMF
jgi:predicted SnoaL-like aldol condensation-catalyzing enzyme